MEKDEMSCNDAVPNHDQIDEADLKGYKRRPHRIFLAIAVLAVVLIAGSFFGVYFTVEETRLPTAESFSGENPRHKNLTCGVPSPARENLTYTGLDGNISYNPRMTTRPPKGTQYGCSEAKPNRFLSKELDCVYVFTDSPSERFIQDTCGENVVSIDEFTTICDTILKDFETCCLKYFQIHDPDWWEFISAVDPEVEELTSRSLTGNYSKAIKQHYGWFNYMYKKATCDMGWDAFHPYWQSVGCKHTPDYSHVCKIDVKNPLFSDGDEDPFWNEGSFYY